jgi:uncharacterized protein DUF4160
VPIISTFFGIVIRMFYQEHEPAHFHAEYQGQQATFLVTGEILAAAIRSGTARRLIRGVGSGAPWRTGGQLGQNEGWPSA